MFLAHGVSGPELFVLALCFLGPGMGVAAVAAFLLHWYSRPRRAAAEVAAATDPAEPRRLGVQDLTTAITDALVSTFVVLVVMACLGIQLPVALTGGLGTSPGARLASVVLTLVGGLSLVSLGVRSRLPARPRAANRHVAAVVVATALLHVVAAAVLWRDRWEVFGPLVAVAMVGLFAGAIGAWFGRVAFELLCRHPYRPIEPR